MASFISDSADIWTVALQAPLSMGFQSRILERVAFPHPGDLPDPGIEPASLLPPALAGRFFTTSTPGKPMFVYECTYIHISF